MSDRLLSIAKEYPVVLVQGPRQSGKTTLCKSLFSDKPYILLENPDILARVTEDPIGFLEQFPNGAVFDEVQQAPHLLSYIQGIVDRKNIPGMYILTGSNNLLLMQSVSQSLAGRIAIFSLLPFSLQEIKDIEKIKNTESRILFGGYPRLISTDMNRSAFYENYISTYVEKDVRTVLKIKEESLFRSFISLCAIRVGNILNITSLARDCGISVVTARQWLSVLETSYILFTLQPYYENRTKRLVKTPKLYFYDTGLACSLLGITDENQLSADKMRGALFENLIILESVKDKFNQLGTEKLFFYRTSDGIEVDLVKQKGRKLFPIEIKASKTFSPDWFKGINKFNSEYPESLGGTVIHEGKESFKFKNMKVQSYLDTSVFD